jgi:hypothetical protein
LWNTIGISLGVEGSIFVNIPERNASQIQRRRKRLGHEFILNSHIDGYEINDAMLDLVSYVNILPKKMWEAMGKPRLVYSLIQLHMENQYCIYLVGRLKNVVQVDLDRFKTVAGFKVIEIMGKKYPYPTLLGID